jgi:hypothetical protein
MPKLENKPLNEPDETRAIEKGTIEIVHLDAGTEPYVGIDVTGAATYARPA